MFVQLVYCGYTKKSLQLNKENLRMDLSLKEELSFRQINLTDEAWLAETYSADEISNVFKSVNIKEISRIAFRLLSDNDRRLFKKQDVIVITEDGEETNETLGGLELFRKLIVGEDDKLAILIALTETINGSRPENKEPTEKKKTTTGKK
jgi:hypothetical protein